MIIILGLVYRKKIRLQIVMLVHGKYSYDYIRTFKKYTNTNPFPYCVKDEILPYLRQSGKANPNVIHYTTLKEPLFEDMPFHIGLPQILKSYGKPDCFNSYLIKGFEVKAFGYYRDVFGSDVLAVFYFFLDKLVMGEYILTESKESLISKFRDTLLEKAGVNDETPVNHFFIDYDEKKSVYYRENAFSVVIRYVNRTDKLFADLIN